jgi:SOS response regulatory protein OraA/RecX
MKAPLDEKKALRLVIFLLSRRSYHSKEIALRLEKKGYSKEVIEAVLSYAKAQKWLSDEEWQSRTLEKLLQKGKSSLEIAKKFREKNITLPTISFSSHDLEALNVLVPKRYPLLLDSKSTKEEKQKAIQALLRRGFSLSSISSFLHYQNEK